MTELLDRQEMLAKFEGPWGPLDYLSLGDRERIHSEAIRWLFTDQSPHARVRDRLLPQLMGPLEPGLTVSGARTEVSLIRRRLDIWIELNGQPDDGIAIENKLLALESRLQTHETASLLSRSSPFPSSKLGGQRPYRPRRMVFLTLSGAPAACPRWGSASYRDLLNAVDEALEENEDSFLNMYRDTLDRLVAAVGLMETAPEGVTQLVFGEGRRAPAGYEALGAYISAMNLRRTLQSVWLERLGGLVETPIHWSPWIIGESRGEALIETACEVLWEDHKLRVGFQLQHNNPKAFVAPVDYRKGLRRSTVEAAGRLAARMLADVQFVASERTRKLTTPRALGFTSTHAFDPPYPRVHSEWAPSVETALAALSEWAETLGVRPYRPACGCAG